MVRRTGGLTVTNEKGLEMLLYLFVNFDGFIMQVYLENVFGPVCVYVYCDIVRWSIHSV